jgi:hypothetical protein
MVVAARVKDFAGVDVGDGGQGCPQARMSRAVRSPLAAVGRAETTIAFVR